MAVMTLLQVIRSFTVIDISPALAYSLAARLSLMSVRYTLKVVHLMRQPCRTLITILLVLDPWAPQGHLSRKSNNGIFSTIKAVRPLQEARGK